jgi:DNA repair photolyase
MRRPSRPSGPAPLNDLNGATPRPRRAPLLPPDFDLAKVAPRPAGGGSRPLLAISDDRERSSALTPTGGFLAGYTHTLNPAVGCVLGRSFCGRYCYARDETPARVVEGATGLAWGEFLISKNRLDQALAADLEKAARRSADHPHHVARLRVFLASTTEPCLGPALAVTRACLRVFARFPVGRIVLQTRSPAVLELGDELDALRDRLIVSLTLESDCDEPHRDLPAPLLPRISARRGALEALSARGIPVCAAVSPCLSIKDPAEFAAWIAQHAGFALVDTFVSGDGRCGARTARTTVPEVYRQRGVDWRDETAARSFFVQLEGLLGRPRAGWSREGFASLATVALPSRTGHATSGAEVELAVPPRSQL